MKASKPRKPRAYPIVVLRREKVKVTRAVHVLVALAFLGPRPPGTQVAHENGNPNDNKLSNLSYKTPSANQADRARHGTECRGERCVTSRLDDATVSAIRAEYAAGGCSHRSLAKKYNVEKTAIDRAINRKTWSHVS